MMKLEMKNFRVLNLLGMLVILMMFVSLSACTSSRGGTIPYGVADFGQPDAPSAAILETDYRIAPLDKLAVNVFQVKELSGEYQVDLTGHIAMPLIGSVRAVDQTTGELQGLLTQKLSAKYLKDPDVTVGISEAGGSKITVEGEVRKSGLLTVYGKTSLLQAIALAGGLQDTANEKRIAIFRQIDGQRMAAAFDLTTIRGGLEPDPEVFRGDIIVVDGSKAKKAMRDVVGALPIAGLFRPLGY